MIVESQIRAIWVTLAVAFFFMGFVALTPDEGLSAFSLFISCVVLGVGCLYNLYKTFQKK